MVYLSIILAVCVIVQESAMRLLAKGSEPLVVRDRFTRTPRRLVNKVGEYLINPITEISEPVEWKHPSVISPDTMELKVDLLGWGAARFQIDVVLTFAVTNVSQAITADTNIYAVLNTIARSTLISMFPRYDHRNGDDNFAPLVVKQLNNQLQTYGITVDKVFIVNLKFA